MRANVRMIFVFVLELTQAASCAALLFVETRRPRQYALRQKDTRYQLRYHYNDEDDENEEDGAVPDPALYILLFAMENDNVERLKSLAVDIDFTTENMHAPIRGRNLLDIADERCYKKVATFLRNKGMTPFNPSLTVMPFQKTSTERECFVTALCHNILVVNGLYKPVHCEINFDNISPQFIDAVDDYSQTFLHKAVYASNQTAIIKLLSMGANPNICDYWGNTPLHVALLMKKHVPTVLLLAARRTNCELKNHQHMSPALLAQFNKSSRLNDAIELINELNILDRPWLFFARLFYGPNKILSVPPHIIDQVNQRA